MVALFARHSDVAKYPSNLGFHVESATRFMSPVARFGIRVQSQWVWEFLLVVAHVAGFQPWTYYHELVGVIENTEQLPSSSQYGGNSSPMGIQWVGLFGIGGRLEVFLQPSSLTRPFR